MDALDCDAFSDHRFHVEWQRRGWKYGTSKHNRTADRQVLHQHRKV